MSIMTRLTCYWFFFFPFKSDLEEELLEEDWLSGKKVSLTALFTLILYSNTQCGFSAYKQEMENNIQNIGVLRLVDDFIK